MSIADAAERSHSTASRLPRTAPAGSHAAAAGCVDGTRAGAVAVPALLTAAARSSFLLSLRTSRAQPGRSDMTDSDPARDGHRGVSAEELIILALISEGLPLNSVAARTGMSSRTIRRRLRCVCDRLKVAHPIQAVVWAARRGLI